METPPSSFIPTPVEISSADRSALLRDPELLRVIRKVASERVPDHAVEDMEQETLLAIDRARSLPATPAARVDFVAGIVRNKAKDWWRENKLQKKVDRKAEVERSDGAAAAEANQHRDTIEKVVAAVPPKQQSTFRCLVREALGESLADIAREMNVEYSTLHKRVTSLRRKLAAAVGGIAFIAMLVGALHRRPVPQMGHDTPAPVPTEAVSTNEPVIDPIAEAREYRKKAFDECLRDEWKECLTDLAAASALDHEGDRDPKVQAAAEDAHRALDSKLGYHPPKVRLYGTAK
jgi:RNA polymerase sigma factor (sigma-70 family)